MAKASTQHPIGRWATAKAVAYGEWVCRTQPTSGWSSYIAVCMATTAPWMGGNSPSSRMPSRPTRTTADGAWPRSDGPPVKYISFAPGTRRLTFPCPFAEIAPLATTRWAASMTWSTRSLSMTPPSRLVAAHRSNATSSPRPSRHVVLAQSALGGSGSEAEALAARAFTCDPRLSRLSWLGQSDGGKRAPTSGGVPPAPGLGTGTVRVAGAVGLGVGVAVGVAVAVAVAALGLADGEVGAGVGRLPEMQGDAVVVSLMRVTSPVLANN